MDIQKKLKELDELREELLSKVSQEDGVKALEKAQVHIEPGSPEHEALLATGYEMTREQAETIIAERKKRPELWPYEMLTKAQAFLAAFESKPQVVSTRPPWRAGQNPRTTGR
jgi:hypothetical protein